MSDKLSFQNTKTDQDLLAFLLLKEDNTTFQMAGLFVPTSEALSAWATAVLRR